LIEGVRIIKKHGGSRRLTRPAKSRKREGPIHIYNVRLIEKEEKKDKKTDANHPRKKKAKS